MTVEKGTAPDKLPSVDSDCDVRSFFIQNASDVSVILEYLQGIVNGKFNLSRFKPTDVSQLARSVPSFFIPDSPFPRT